VRKGVGPIHGVIQTSGAGDVMGADFADETTAYWALGAFRFFPRIYKCPALESARRLSFRVDVQSTGARDIHLSACSSQCGPPYSLRVMRSIAAVSLLTNRWTPLERCQLRGVARNFGWK
jgi:hypothetical protein